MNDVFRKFVCIYLIVYSSIGSDGPFPLLKYCALPIAITRFNCMYILLPFTGVSLCVYLLSYVV